MACGSLLGVGCLLFVVCRWLCVVCWPSVRLA